MSAEDGTSPPSTNPLDTRLLDKRIEAALASRGGGGQGGGDRFEARIAKLESDVANLAENVKTSTADLKMVLQRLTVVETEIKHLPTKGFILTAVTAALTFSSALVLFQHQIQQAIGLAASGK